MNSSFPPTPVQDPKTPSTRGAIPFGVHLMCGWPLVLVAVGGAIGGGLGGLAYGVNLAIYKSNMPVPVKILLNIVTGISAFVIWLAIGMVVKGMRK